jgi:subtilase family serine protease
MSNINTQTLLNQFSNVKTCCICTSNTISSNNQKYKPKQFVKAYGIDKIVTPNNSLPGTGIKVGVVIPFYYPTLQSDFNTFCTENNLPQQTITILNPTGTVTTNDSFNQECALDIQSIHTLAPGATIIVSIAPSANLADLQPAILTAVTAGANVINMSWGINLTYDQYTIFNATNTLYANFATVFENTSVSYIAASGDLTNIPQFPSTCANVVSVGGTSLYLKKNSRRKCETPWTSTSTASSGSTPTITNYTTGSGCGYSPYNAQPTYQIGINTIPLTYRAVPDVVMAGDPATGFQVYYTPVNATTGQFIYLGGTSLSTALFSAIIAIANQLRLAVNKPFLTSVDGAATAQLQTYLYHVIYYGNAKTPYKSCKPYCGNFFDINESNCGAYYAGKGYDMASGLGSPNANILTRTLVNA